MTNQHKSQAQINTQFNNLYEKLDQVAMQIEGLYKEQLALYGFEMTDELIHEIRLDIYECGIYETTAWDDLNDLYVLRNFYGRVVKEPA